MKRTKRMLSLALCLLTAISTIAMADVTAFAASDITVVADWRFDEDGVISGTIEGRDMIIKDQSGNGNDLQMRTFGSYDLSPYMYFSDDTMYGGTSGSIVIGGGPSDRRGAALITVDSAPIKTETFDDCYTIEFVYQLPADYTAPLDGWMTLLQREGTSSYINERNKGTMSVCLSNCKEIQFKVVNKANNYNMGDIWGLSMDKGGVWYHMAITSDGEWLRTYVNGCLAFRNHQSTRTVGMYADPTAGAFRLFSNIAGTQFGRGKYQQVRISSGCLPREDWLIPNPEDFIDEYGTNDEFSLSSPDNYNFVFMPDTQNTIKFTPNVMHNAFDWLVENQAKTNIAAITHLGDIVENWNDNTQWSNARTSFSKLPAGGITTLMQPGNHDYSGTNYSYFLNNFGPNSDYSRLSGSNLYITSPSGMSAYVTVDAGSYKYIVMSLSHSHLGNTTSQANIAEQTWFEDVLKANPNIPTIVTSHNLQDCSDSAPSSIRTNAYGQRIWNIIRKYDQVFMMVGGHNHGAGHEVLKNDSGKDVFSVLADYQFGYNGGNAFFKFAEFDENNNKLTISTFSPYSAGMDPAEKTFFDVNYLTGLGNYVELPLNFAERFADADRAFGAMYLSTDANLVRNGGYFRLYPAFYETVKSNASKLTFTFDAGKFEYRGFTPAEGVSLLDTALTEGRLEMTFMVNEYKIDNYGEVLFSAKEDAELANEYNVIRVSAEFVAKAEDDSKFVHKSNAAVSFTTLGNATYTLFDISNLIDWFGIKSGDAEWAQSKFFDFNNNGEIDIQDIAALAQMID